MCVLSRGDILLALHRGDIQILPFDKEVVRENGLDLRVGNEYCRLKGEPAPVNAGEDHAIYDPRPYYECGRIPRDGLVLEPHGYYLLHTREIVSLGPNIVGFANLRSTMARLGLIIPPTVVDAGFKGQVVVEVHSGPIPVRVMSGDRFLHLILVRTETPAPPYRGVYHNQMGVRLPKMFKRL